MIFLIVGGYLFSLISSTMDLPWLATMLAVGITLIFGRLILKDIRENHLHLKDLSYDRGNLYILEKGREEQIPFYRIKDVELTSLSGIYQFNFYDKDLHGGWVSCKTSMWYPLNFPKVDRELERVRQLIRRAHELYEHEQPNNQLTSFN